MKRKKKNALFSFHPAMVPRRTRVSARRHTRKATARSTPSMGMRLSQAERLKEERLLREIAKLGRRGNPVAKKRKSRKKRQPAALARYWAKKRKKKNARRKVRSVKRRRPVARRRRRPVARRRVVRRRRSVTRNPKRRTLRLGLTLNTKQKRRLASFLRSATGRRVKVQ
jgi:hypothetical protein